MVRIWDLWVVAVPDLGVVEAHSTRVEAHRSRRFLHRDERTNGRLFALHRATRVADHARIDVAGLDADQRGFEFGRAAVNVMVQSMPRSGPFFPSPLIGPPTGLASMAPSARHWNW